MRRKLLKTDSCVRGYGDIPVEIPEDIAAYLARVRLLYPVPFGCLVTDEKLLPAESMRFFILDENWCDALVDGALSVGRNDSRSARSDCAVLEPALAGARENMGRVRHEKVHENHRTALRAVSGGETVRSGFLLRSQLTRRWKGLELHGYGGDRLLTVLRIDMVAADILLCIFEGEVTRVTILEPKAGIRFGVKSSDRAVPLREIREGGDFGRFRPEKVTLKCDANGRLDVMAARRDMEAVLGAGRVTPSVFAFELMLAAEEAGLTAKGGMGNAVSDRSDAGGDICERK